MDGAEAVEACDRESVDVSIGVRDGLVREAFPVSRPGWFTTLVVADCAESAAVGTVDVDPPSDAIGETLSRRELVLNVEGDPLAARRPCCSGDARVVPPDFAAVESERARRQPAHVAAAAVHDVEVGGPVASAQEDDSPVARNGRMHVERLVVRQVRPVSCEVDRNYLEIGRPLVVASVAGACAHHYPRERDREDEPAVHADLWSIALSV